MKYLLGYGPIFIGLIPLLALLYFREMRRPVWYIACGFAVSFAADLAGLAGYGDIAGNLYPLLQTGLIALAFLPVERVAHVVGALGLIAASVVMVGGYAGHDWILATAASIIACAVVRGRVRWSIYLTFGLGGIAWLWYCRTPGFTPLYTYQACRLAGALAYVAAVRKDHP